jgi:hypothetical protein
MSLLDPRRARAVVEARLGRPVQDSLEAAVVLEAWYGLQAREALDRGRALIGHAGAPARRGRHIDEQEPSRRNARTDGISLVLAIVAVAMWAAPLSAMLGAAVWDTAVRIALPLTFALQWVMWSRHFSKGEGLGSMRAEGPAAIVGLAAIAAVLVSLGDGGAVAALLLISWTSGTVLVSRGWGVLYATVLALVGLGLQLELDAYALLGGAALCSIAAVAAAVATSGPPTSSPGNWYQALVVGAIGAGLGALLVTDHTIGWGFYGALPALALIPSAVGGLWGGLHLSRVHVELPRVLRETPAAHADAAHLTGPGLAILAGSVLRLGLATVVLSAMCMLAGPWTSGTIATSLFVGFGCLALATLLVSLLVSLGRMAWALAAVSVAVLVEVAVELPTALAHPGSGLIAGGLIASALVLPPLVKLFLRPGRALATAVWIA